MAIPTVGTFTFTPAGRGFAMYKVTNVHADKGRIVAVEITHTKSGKKRVVTPDYDSKSKRKAIKLRYYKTEAGAQKAIDKKKAQ